MSSDGNTALIGRPGDKSEIGAAWVFVNIPAKSPTVVTRSASLLTPSSVTLNATVNPNGETVTDCHFEYGTSTAYGTNVPCASLPGSGGSPVAVSASIEGLSHTICHFRIVATNALGTSEDADQRFTTEEAPEYGRCVKVTPVKEAGKLVYHGGFTASTCLLRSETKTGKYEWIPGVAKAHFTTALKEGVVTFETVKTVKTTCKTENGSGEYSGQQEVGNVATDRRRAARPARRIGQAHRRVGRRLPRSLRRPGVVDADRRLHSRPCARTGPCARLTSSRRTVVDRSRAAQYWPTAYC